MTTRFDVHVLTDMIQVLEIFQVKHFVQCLFISREEQDSIFHGTCLLLCKQRQRMSYRVHGVNAVTFHSVPASCIAPLLTHCHCLLAADNLSGSLSSGNSCLGCYARLWRAALRLDCNGSFLVSFAQVPEIEAEPGSLRSNCLSTLSPGFRNMPAKVEGVSSKFTEAGENIFTEAEEKGRKQSLRIAEQDWDGRAYLALAHLCSIQAPWLP